MFSCEKILQQLYEQKGESVSPWTGSVLCSIPWENPSGLHPMLHEHEMPSICGDGGCTHYPYASSYPVLQNLLFYEAIYCLAFLAEMHKEPCSIPLSPHLTPSQGGLHNSLFCLFSPHVPAAVTLPLGPLPPAPLAHFPPHSPESQPTDASEMA